MHWIDAQELAGIAVGLDNGDDPMVVEQAVYDRFEVSLEQFQAIAEALLPLTIPARAAISGESFRGFVKDGVFIVREPVGSE